MNSQNPWWVLPGLAITIILGFESATIASCFMGNETLMTTMFTAQVGLITGVAGFYWGSSEGSRIKTDIISAGAVTAKTVADLSEAARLRREELLRSDDPRLAVVRELKLRAGLGDGDLAPDSMLRDAGFSPDEIAQYRAALRS